MPTRSSASIISSAVAGAPNGGMSSSEKAGGADDGLAGAVPEQVGAVRPDEGGCPRPVVTGREHQVGASAHHRERTPAELALRQLGDRRDLVGDRGRRHRQLVAVLVDAADVGLEYDDPGRADRDVGLPLAPCATGGVGDDHADVAAGALGDRAPQPGGGGIRVDRQEYDGAAGDVRRVHSRRGHRQPQPVAHDPGRTATRDQPHRLGGDPVLAVAVDDPALGLAHHLARHDDDVAVGELDHRDQEVGQVVARPDLRHPVRGGDGQHQGRTSSMAAAAIAAVASWSVIIRGTAALRIPACSSAATWSASRSSTSQPSSTPPALRAP